MQLMQSMDGTDGTYQSWMTTGPPPLWYCILVNQPIMSMTLEAVLGQRSSCQSKY